MVHLPANKPINISVNLSGNRSTVSRNKRRLKFAKGKGYTRRKKESGFIRFYDLGQYLGEDDLWKDTILDIGSQAVVTQHPTNEDLVITLDPFTLADWATVYDILTQVPLSQWTDTYREITKDASNKYEMAYFNEATGYVTQFFDDNNPLWTDKGLNTTDPFRFRSYRMFLDFDLSDLVNYKITNEYDYDAPSVGLNLQGGAHVFLIPEVTYYTYAHSQDYWPTFLSYDSFAVCRWGQLSREMLLNKTAYSIGIWPFDPGHTGLNTEHPAFKITPALGRYQSTNPAYTQVGGIGMSFVTDTFRDEYDAYYLRFQDPRYFREKYDNGVWSWSELSPDNFPATDGSEFRQDQLMHCHDLDQSDYCYLDEGNLRAIIQQGSKTYYVWRNTPNGVVIYEQPTYPRLAWAI